MTFDKVYIKGDKSKSFDVSFVRTMGSVFLRRPWFHRFFFDFGYAAPADWWFFVAEKTNTYRDMVRTQN
jgi:hypothetical protein